MRKQHPLHFLNGSTFQKKRSQYCTYKTKHLFNQEAKNIFNLFYSIKGLKHRANHVIF